MKTNFNNMRLLLLAPLYAVKHNPQTGLREERKRRATCFCLSGWCTVFAHFHPLLLIRNLALSWRGPAFCFPMPLYFNLIILWNIIILPSLEPENAELIILFLASALFIAAKWRPVTVTACQFWDQLLPPCRWPLHYISIVMTFWPFS